MLGTTVYSAIFSACFIRFPLEYMPAFGDSVTYAPIDIVLMLALLAGFIAIHVFAWFRYRKTFAVSRLKTAGLLLRNAAVGFAAGVLLTMGLIEMIEELRTLKKMK